MTLPRFREPTQRPEREPARDPMYGDDTTPRPLTWAEVAGAWRDALAAALLVAGSILVAPYVWAFVEAVR